MNPIYILLASVIIGAISVNITFKILGIKGPPKAKTWVDFLQYWGILHRPIRRAELKYFVLGAVVFFPSVYISRAALLWLFDSNGP